MHAHAFDVLARDETSAVYSPRDQSAQPFGPEMRNTSSTQRLFDADLYRLADWLPLASPAVNPLP